jgi:pimeloyl-ACP methyl ester carboxylesterase
VQRTLDADDAIWSQLGETTRLIAIDLPGFGGSERSDVLMTPRAMGDFIIRAADAFQLKHRHIVGPDVGTPAAPFAPAGGPAVSRHTRLMSVEEVLH